VLGEQSSDNKRAVTPSIKNPALWRGFFLYETNLRFFSSRRQKDVTFCRATLFPAAGSLAGFRFHPALHNPAHAYTPGFSVMVLTKHKRCGIIRNK
jgi:hypothetical protein